MAINVAGLLAIIFFYVIILVVGIWAGRKTNAPRRSTLSMSIGEQSNIMLAGRNIGLFVGVFTMTATWVGGGYINGTAEVVYISGLAWCQAPFGYALSLLIGGYLFAVKMRKAGYKTMLDPFQQHFGARMGCLLFLPALCGEVFWSAAILAALGATVEVIMDFERTESVVASACIALFYTFTGGLYSVAYTDVIQLLAIFFGLWLSVPFAMFHEAVGPISYPRNDFVGSVEWRDFGIYWDSMLLLMMGGVPWQVYFQRVLSSRTAEGAELLSYMASFGCLFMAIPPVIIGAVAKAANLTQAGYTKPIPLTGEATSLTLPLVLQYLTPGFVSAMGLGAVSAAVMSSSDSSILSAASMFAWNIYKLGIRQNATEKEVIGVMRVSIVLVGALATFMALTAESIYGLWYLSSDLVYVILFPQLVSVVYLKEHVNTYGSFAAYVVGCVLRAGGGESILRIPPFIKYPFYDYEQDMQLFPFRTFSMVISFLTLVVVSGASSWLFAGGHAPLDWDVFHCFQPDAKVPDAKVADKAPLVEGAALKAHPAAGPPPAAAEPALTPSAASAAETSAAVGSTTSASTTAREIAVTAPPSGSEEKLSQVEKVPDRPSPHSADLTFKSHPVASAKSNTSKDASEMSTSKRKRKKHRRSSQGSRKSAHSDTSQPRRPSAPHEEAHDSKHH
ncbi:high-affinity choline transporter 1 [Dermacentor silvarum]|uniref:high-affinity choline transporter 1 n=1 Tax=Dermacentor silvarum TaxID=543639 RepID=UPI0018973F6D|nr:high-affinity choline transporter 1 [Dermacentor silvarum]